MVVYGGALYGEIVYLRNLDFQKLLVVFVFDNWRGLTDFSLMCKRESISFKGKHFYKDVVLLSMKVGSLRVDVSFFWE